MKLRLFADIIKDRLCAADFQPAIGPLPRAAQPDGLASTPRCGPAGRRISVVKFPPFRAQLFQ
jgi:hypothetical protein